MKGVCGIDGNLKVGDQIVELNGQSMLQSTHDEAIDIFRRCKSEIDITVARMVDVALLDTAPMTGDKKSSRQPYCSNDEPIVLEHKKLTMSH